MDRKNHCALNRPSLEWRAFLALLCHDLEWLKSRRNRLQVYRTGPGIASPVSTLLIATYDLFGL